MSYQGISVSKGEEELLFRGAAQAFALLCIGRGGGGMERVVVPDRGMQARAGAGA